MDINFNEYEYFDHNNELLVFEKGKVNLFRSINYLTYENLNRKYVQVHEKPFKDFEFMKRTQTELDMTNFIFTDYYLYFKNNEYKNPIIQPANEDFIIYFKIDFENEVIRDILISLNDGYEQNFKIEFEYDLTKDRDITSIISKIIYNVLIERSNLELYISKKEMHEKDANLISFRNYIYETSTRLNNLKDIKNFQIKNKFK